MSGAKTGHAREIDFPPRSPAVGQPAQAPPVAAKHLVMSLNARGSNNRGSRNAIHRRFDAGKKFQGLRADIFLLHDIAGETYKIRRQGIDQVHDGLGMGAVAFVMQITEINDLSALASPPPGKPAKLDHCGSSIRRRHEPHQAVNSKWQE